MTAAPSSTGLSRRIRSTVNRLGRDLLFVSVAAVLALSVLSESGLEIAWLRTVIGLPLVLVFPGYALVSALFPTRPSDVEQVAGRGPAYSPGTTERLVLSFVCSLAILPILAVGHGLLGVPFETATVLGSVTAVVVGLSAVAIVRRRALSVTERYDPPSLVAAGRRFSDWVTAGGTTDTVFSAVLAVTVVLAVGALGYGLVSPGQGESYTSVSLVTEGESGELVASNYPTNVSAGEERNLTVQVENHYQTAGNYTTVVELQRVEGRETGSVDVVQRDRVGSFTAQIPANETWTRTHAVEPTMTGEELRLVYYVYRGDVPATPDADSAEGTVHLWVTVQ